MISVTDDLVLTEPWCDLRGTDPEDAEQRQGLRDELARELSPGHPLHNRTVTVLGRSHLGDDILIAPEGAAWAIVHLTWKHAPERPPWPATRFYDNAQELEEALYGQQTSSNRPDTVSGRHHPRPAACVSDHAAALRAARAQAAEQHVGRDMTRSAASPSAWTSSSVRRTLGAEV
jgi:hypothetical protein